MAEVIFVTEKEGVQKEKMDALEIVNCDDFDRIVDCIDGKESNLTEEIMSNLIERFGENFTIKQDRKGWYLKISEKQRKDYLLNALTKVEEEINKTKKRIQSDQAYDTDLIAYKLFAFFKDLTLVYIPSEDHGISIKKFIMSEAKIDTKYYLYQAYGYHHV